MVALENAGTVHSTVQNWYPGMRMVLVALYNFVTKRGDCRGKELKDLMDPSGNWLCCDMEVSCILRGDNSVEFYSIAISNSYQQIDSGTKMVQTWR